MKRTIFLIVIICVILYFQYPHINQVNNTFEILQFNNPDKSIFENMMNEKKVAIFTNIPVELEFNGILPEYFTKEFSTKLQNNNEFNSILNKNLEYYKIPICVTKKSNISFFDSTSNLIYQNNYRFLLINLHNTIKISLFNPNQKNNLYFDSSNKSSINFYNDNYEKYPKLNDVKYIEVLLHKNQMISIPYKWIYIINKHEEQDSLLLSYINESVFSKILKK
jgi:hypothetical protein